MAVCLCVCWDCSYKYRTITWSAPPTSHQLTGRRGSVTSLLDLLLLLASSARVQVPVRVTREGTGKERRERREPVSTVVQLYSRTNRSCELTHRLLYS